VISVFNFAKRTILMTIVPIKIRVKIANVIATGLVRTFEIIDFIFILSFIIAL